MSKITLIIYLIAICCIQLFGQTTEEEYQYVTYGYREQLQKGLDDKEGYYWKPIYQHKFQYEVDKFFRKETHIGLFDFEGLFRKGSSTPCATVAIYREKDNMSKKDGLFICLPHHESTQGISDKAELHLKEKACFSKQIMHHYIVALGKMAMAYSACKK